MALRLVPTPLPDPNPADSLGERIVSARGYRRLNQDDLLEEMERLAADRDDVKAPSRRTLSSWENDDTSPTVKSLTLLARALDTTAMWFVQDLGATDSDGPDGGGEQAKSQSRCIARPSGDATNVTDLATRRHRAVPVQLPDAA